jgi:hypothetical protein
MGEWWAHIHPGLRQEAEPEDPSISKMGLKKTDQTR